MRYIDCPTCNANGKHGLLNFQLGLTPDKLVVWCDRCQHNIATGDLTWTLEGAAHHTEAPYVQLKGRTGAEALAWLQEHPDASVWCYPEAEIEEEQK